jgi:citrate lyase subunit beta/citryl-CoA lyase
LTVLRPDLRRSVLFVAGADARAHESALAARPDVLVQDLEDFTPRELKAAARAATASLAERAAASGIVFAVRIDALEAGGRDDVAVALAARSAIVMLPKASAAAVAELDRILARVEADLAIAVGTTEMVPNVETAAGVVGLPAIAAASARVASALLATEDLAADLCAERGPDAEELAYVRSRFLLEARALALEPIDAPYTYSDADGCEREARRSRRLGYRSKSAVGAAHVAVLHRVLTPSEDEVAAARRLVAAFEAARASGVDRPHVDGLWVEPPAYRTALRLIERASALARGSVRAR